MGSSGGLSIVATTERRPLLEGEREGGGSGGCGERWRGREREREGRRERETETDKIERESVCVIEVAGDDESR
jgi:hypothetical protein